MKIDRRDALKSVVATGAIAQVAPSLAQPVPRRFPQGFLWGAATAGHQVEGNNTNSDTWAVEHLKPTSFAAPSGDACDSFNRWPIDHEMVRSLGLNTYRFSLEWARIEPAPGEFSVAMLDHYKAMIDGCRKVGLAPVVTFSHFTCPRWFAAMGGWTNPDAPQLFARFCDRAARHMAGNIHAVVTLNEPNLMRLLRFKLPPQALAGKDAVRAAAAKAYDAPAFVAQFIESVQQTDAMVPIMIEAHRQGKAAIKAVRTSLPVGMSLAIEDDQPVGAASRCDEKRRYYYGPWLEAARQDDFIGVQNYERARIDERGQMPPPEGAEKTTRGTEIYPESLAGAVTYAWKTAGVPVLVTEHGVGTSNDSQRAAFIPAALRGLHAAMDKGVPVLGYIHWSLLDNFEWVFGYDPKFGLASVDRTTFQRKFKPSASVLGQIAKHNAI
ncbi:family 1 glycosylhydrolase [Novosphingobium sp.]|uniref:glycoside hydrolase family 1 protein n=1 Tax=Novosphingobium sp. TaxID=1874826 RepID=UPI0025D63552|nr:family 1 glycosylhydrolase [Novosphingobium sp.]